MAWRDVDLVHLIQAMDYCNEHELDNVRVDFGFSRPVNRQMYYQHRGPYPARVLIAVAHFLQFPRASRLSPESFTGEAGNPQKFLVKKGFESRPIDPV